MEYLQNILADTWAIVGQMSPYLLFGFLMAGVLNVLISPSWIERHLGGRGVWPVLKASAFGVPLPLCSCSVIPVGASLRRHGATKGATTAFLISTPQTGIDSIFVTLSLLGPIFAVFRPLVALLSGVIGGGLIAAVPNDDVPDASGQVCQDECCEDRGKRHWLARVFRYGFVVLARDIAGALLIGLVVAAAITALVPDDFFADQLGGVLAGGLGAMLIMMALGIPVYVCATASVPVAAALILKGVSPGAALVFLMTGPATNAATIATIWRTMGTRTAVIYLLTVAVTAVLAGLGLDLIVEAASVTVHPPGHDMLPEWAKIVCTALLLAVLAHAMVRRRKAPPTNGHDTHEADEPCEHTECAHEEH